LHAFATNKKSGYERESAAIAFQSLATILGPPIAPILLPSLPLLFDLYMDKGDVVRIAATAAVKSILKLFPPESTRVVYRTLENILGNGKWRTKVGALDALKSFVNTARDEVAAELGNVLPKVEAAMHDTKQEVRRRPACTFCLSNHPLVRFLPQRSKLRHHYVQHLPIPILFLTSQCLSNACQTQILCLHASKLYLRQLSWPK
jgi:hypothetical protein